MNNFAFEQYFLKTNPNWLLSLEEKINCIAASLGLKDLEVNPNARFGVVVFCRKDKTELVLKLVDKDSEKGKKELMAVDNLKYSFMHKATHLSYNDGFYLSERASELLLPSCNDVNGRFDTIISIFKCVINEWASNNIGQDTYLPKFLSRIELTKRYKVPQSFITHINQAIKLYKKIFDGEICRLIHGDLHEKNILSFKGGLIAIDPIGGYAPLEFEFTKYIENQLFMLDNKVDINNAVDLLIDKFCALGIDAKKLLSALYIDSVGRTSTSFLLDDPLEIINRGFERIIMIGERI